MSTTVTVPADNSAEIDIPATTNSETISQLLSLTYQTSKLLSNPIANTLIIPMLGYHLFVYIYLGIQAGGSDFYTGFMYAFNYAGTAVAYWIVCRQSRCLVTTNSIICNELVEPREDTTQHCGGQYHSSHFQLLEEIRKLLVVYPVHYQQFTTYCYTWRRRSLGIFVVWIGFALVNVILKALPDSIGGLYPTFDDKPLGLYGYYNLAGQPLAAACIVTAAITMLTGFFAVKMLILGFTAHVRQFRKPTEPDPSVRDSLTMTTRETYLTVQKTCLALGELWTIPVLVGLFFCTQVVIANILVIHYSLADCDTSKNCGFSLFYSVVWLLVALFMMAYVLFSMASINQAAQMLRQIFVYANGGSQQTEDYAVIGGRTDWMEYLDSNQLQFSVAGMVVSPTLVVNTCYTVSTAIASFLAANLFG